MERPLCNHNNKLIVVMKVNAGSTLTDDWTHLYVSRWKTNGSMKPEKVKYYTFNGANQVYLGAV